MTEPTIPKTYQDMLLDLWKTFDWSLTDCALAMKLCVCPGTVSRWRYKVQSGVSPSPFSKYDVDWDALDWSRNNALLSRDCGIDAKVIGSYRMRMGKQMPTVHAFNIILTDERLATVDWEMTADADIARAFGVSRERIRQIRLKLGKPQCKVKGLHLKAATILRWLVENRDNLEGKSLSEIAELAPHEGTARPVVYDLIKRSGIKLGPGSPHFRHRGFDWNQINFDLPNIVLSLIWGFSQCRIGTTRNINFKPYQKWWLGGFSKEIHEPELLLAIEEEKQKAIAAGIGVDEQKLDDWIKWKQQVRTWNDVRAMERIKP